MVQGLSRKNSIESLKTDEDRIGNVPGLDREPVRILLHSTKVSSYCLYVTSLLRNLFFVQTQMIDKIETNRFSNVKNILATRNAANRLDCYFEIRFLLP